MRSAIAAIPTSAARRIREAAAAFTPSSRSRGTGIASRYFSVPRAASPAMRSPNSTAVTITTR